MVMIKRRISVVIFCTAIILSLAGCKQKTDTAEKESKVSTIQTEAADETTADETSYAETSDYNDAEAVTIDTTAPETAPSQVETETSLVTEYVPPETAAPIISQQPVQNAATPQAEAPSATSPPKAASGSETSPAEPKQPVSRPVEKTKAPEFNIDYWISFAKNYAVSIGLDLSPDAVECWDNPIIASAHSKYLERDITDCLNRYKNIEGFTGVWIWSEPDGKGSHILYIGYE